MTSPTTPEQAKKPAGSQETVFFSPGMIAAIIGIIVLVIIFLVVTGSGSSSVPGAVAPQVCAEKTVTYVNTNLVQPGTTASLVSVTEEHGMYTIKLSYLSRESILYTSKDCSLLFMNPVNMQAPRATPTPTPAPVKSDRPTVDLYTMAFCPYGTQAETAMRPVYDLLGKKADIRIRYITTVQGSTIETVSSTHGNAEAKESAFQLCVKKSDPASYWEYVRLFNEQCYPKWYDTESVDTCRKNVTSMLKIDHEQVSSCAAGPDAIALLKSDETDSNANYASSSPTLLINGIEYYGARTPEAYKQAICNSFSTVPGECATILSSTSVSATGSC